jgi:hypothetical protein
MLCVLSSLRLLQEAISSKAEELNKLTQEFEAALAKGLIPKVSTELTHDAKIPRLNRAAIYSFSIGIILLGVFVAHNLLAA